LAGKPDRVFDSLRLQELVDFWHCKGRVSPEINARNLALVARHDRLENTIPAIGAVHVAGTQRAAFQVAELIKNERRIVAGAGLMTVPDAHLLRAVHRAHARIYIEHDAPRRTAAVDEVNPLARCLKEQRGS
jgi:hypothetical protein